MLHRFEVHNITPAIMDVEPSESTGTPSAIPVLNDSTLYECIEADDDCFPQLLSAARCETSAVSQLIESVRTNEENRSKEISCCHEAIE